MSKNIIVLSRDEANEVLEVIEEQQRLLQILIDSYPTQTETIKDRMTIGIDRIMRKTANLRKRLAD